MGVFTLAYMYSEFSRPFRTRAELCDSPKCEPKISFEKPQAVANISRLFDAKQTQIDPSDVRSDPRQSRSLFLIDVTSDNFLNLDNGTIPDPRKDFLVCIWV